MIIDAAQIMDYKLVSFIVVDKIFFVLIIYCCLLIMFKSIMDKPSNETTFARFRVTNDKYLQCRHFYL
jgi:hypothetical protein